MTNDQIDKAVAELNRLIDKDVLDFRNVTIAMQGIYTMLAEICKRIPQRF